MTDPITRIQKIDPAQIHQAIHVLVSKEITVTDSSPSRAEPVTRIELSKVGGLASKSFSKDSATTAVDPKNMAYNADAALFNQAHPEKGVLMSRLAGRDSGLDR